MLAFFAALALADAQCLEQVADDLVAAMQIAQGQTPVNQSANIFPIDQHAVICGDLLLQDEQKLPIELRPRQSSAKVIDTFAFGNAYEVEELLLRMYEMGEEVSEFHIVEGDRDFLGTKKPYEFEAVLNNGQFDAWKDKITYYKVKIPMGKRGYSLQEFQRQQMRSQMKDYHPKDILLEGDLDEIVSDKTLKILKNCEPVAGSWNTRIRMGNFYFSLAWITGDWTGPTTAGFFSDGPSPTAVPTLLESDANASHYPNMPTLKSQDIWQRPNMLTRRDGRFPGWHVSWTLNGSAGLAHKFFIHWEGMPDWAKFPDEASLTKFLDSGFYENANSYEHGIHPSRLSKEDMPQAVIRHPEKFPTILRGVKF
eukprot:s963_g14.t1